MKEHAEENKLNKVETAPASQSVFDMVSVKNKAEQQVAAPA